MAERSWISRLRDRLRQAGMMGKLLVGNPSGEIQMLVRSDVVLYYTLLHGARRDDLLDLGNALWLNPGYWKGHRTYAEACAALARRLAEVARLGQREEERVLDVGFGYGDQDILWAREHGVQIVGLNITPAQVEIAQERVRRAGLKEKIELRLGSATEIPFPAESFDAVLALDCAFHFRTRETFFAEAFRVLRPGGRLAIADMAPAPGEGRSSVWRRLARRRSDIPAANLYDRFAYAGKLRDRGFGDVTVESIAPWVYPGLARYLDLRAQGVPRSEIAVDLEPGSSATDDWSNGWGLFFGGDDFILARADKPGGAGG